MWLFCVVPNPLSLDSPLSRDCRNNPEQRVRFITDGLKERNLVGPDEHRVVSLERVDLTDAQKREGRFYDAATVLVFNQNCGAFRKGESAQLVAITDKGLVVEAQEVVQVEAESGDGRAELEGVDEGDASCSCGGRRGGGLSAGRNGRRRERKPIRAARFG